MAPVKMTGLRKSYGKHEVIHGVDIEIAEGEFVALVGPSGCGKSTLLRMIAGLEEITDGELRIGDRVVNDVASKDRDIAMVFQSYALYPHLTVADNLGFSLKMRKAPRAEMQARVTEAARILGLEPLLDRRPKQLSGGQRQRVAMGRAIVRDPQVFLFDEPLSNLDAKLRVQMRGEIKSLHRRLKTTTIYVTHDQVEAMTMADRIVVLRDGIVEQAGKPLDLYERPANAFVASFIGSPAMNMLPATVSVDGRTLELHAGGRVGVPGASLKPGDNLVVGVRPEDFAISEQGLRANVISVEPTGSETLCSVDAGGTPLTIVVRDKRRLAEGETIGLEAKTLHVFDQDGLRVA